MERIIKAMNDLIKEPTPFYSAHPFLTIFGIVCVIWVSICEFIKWYPSNSFERFIKWSIIWLVIAVVSVIVIFICVITYADWPDRIKNGLGYAVLVLSLRWYLDDIIGKFVANEANKAARKLEADGQIIEKLGNISHTLSSIERKLENNDKK